MDFNSASCKCSSGFFGSSCSLEISERTVDTLIPNIDSVLDSIDINSELTNEDINYISSLQSILEQFPDKIPEDIKSHIVNLAKSQIDLIMNGNINPNPNLLNILDLSLGISL